MLALTACGGGGSGSSSIATATTSTGSAGTSAAAAATVTARLSGVAALGAPMAGARVQVIDATGVLVGSTTTNAADGSYALTLKPAVGPLMLQAAGTDATGQPLVLHSAVPTLSTAVIANITPLTDAILATVLGVEPRTVFAAARTQPAPLQGLATLTPATDFVKSLVKANLTDAKTGDAKKLDLFSDSSFIATKVGVDLALESLTVGYGSNAKGGVQLQLANKLIPLQLDNKLSGVPLEVTVDLGIAKTELAKATGAAPATAITSTLKTTTSPTTLMATLGSLDDLAVAINKAIAEGRAADSTEVKALLVKYTQNNGDVAEVVGDTIAGWATNKQQLGRLQVTGCADEPVEKTVKTPCARVAVAARVNNVDGVQTKSFANVVSYDAKASPKWQLVGNGQVASLSAYSVAWRSLRADGSALGIEGGAGAISITDPQLGVQVQVVGNTVASATVQTPSGYVLTQVPCSFNPLLLCIDRNSNEPAKGILDDTVFSGRSDWMGAADLALGAFYKIALVNADASTVTRTAVLRGVFGAAPESSRFPVIDDIGSSQPLPGTALLSPTSLAWANWAAANPDLRVVFVRSVITDSAGVATMVDQSPKTWQATSLELQPPDLPPDVAGLTLWLAAVDAAGRWYYTSYTLL